MPEEGFHYGVFKTYLAPIKRIEELVDLKFSKSVRDADVFGMDEVEEMFAPARYIEINSKASDSDQCRRRRSKLSRAIVKPILFTSGVVMLPAWILWIEKDGHVFQGDRLKHLGIGVVACMILVFTPGAFIRLTTGVIKWMVSGWRHFHGRIWVLAALVVSAAMITLVGLGLFNIYSHFGMPEKVFFFLRATELTKGDDRLPHLQSAEGGSPYGSDLRRLLAFLSEAVHPVGRRPAVRLVFQVGRERRLAKCPAETPLFAGRAGGTDRASQRLARRFVAGDWRRARRRRVAG